MEELLEKFKVGNTAVIGLSTEDEDLNGFLDEYGNRIVITEIEEEDGEPTGNFWGVQLTHKVHCPYHLELMDVTNIALIYFPRFQEGKRKSSDDGNKLMLKR